jgi:A/G-specific adenine glycosylase
MLSTTNKKKIRDFRRRLFIWGRRHGRDFPWRRKSTPYNILIAEFFLQRTKAPQAEKQFRLFIKRYPNFFALKNVSSRRIKKYFEPLGLRKRIPIFKKLVNIINKKFGGKIPSRYNSLIKLPGIGDYTASAIEVFALNRRKPLIDANTIKIFSYLLGKKMTREEGKRSKLIRECATYFSSLGRNCRKANWLLLDYGTIRTNFSKY